MLSELNNFLKGIDSEVEKCYINKVADLSDLKTTFQKVVDAIKLS